MGNYDTIKYMLQALGICKRILLRLLKQNVTNEVSNMRGSKKERVVPWEHEATHFRPHDKNISASSNSKCKPQNYAAEVRSCLYPPSAPRTPDPAHQ